MDIPTSSGKAGTRSAGRAGRRRPLLLLSAALVLAVVFLAGSLAERRGWLQRSVSAASRAVALVAQPVDWRDEWQIQPPRLILDVRQKHIDKLEAKRAEALERGVLFSGDEDWVPAKVSIGDESVRARVRLKGDWVGFRSRGADHLGREKWSFRVKTRGDATLLGMKQFSIQHPGTRGFVYEWLFHRALAREGLIALRYDFVDVTLNGKDWGLYALEEHFEKRLIEHNQRREGPIIRFNEDLVWRDRARDFEPGGVDYHSSPIDGFKLGSTLESETLRGQYVQAVSLLEGFRQGELDVAQVFDLEQLARYYALADLFGGHHVAIFHNLRFYYNPVTSRLEPVGFDANAGRELESIVGVQIRSDPSPYYDFGHRLFTDPDFNAAYHRNLERFSRDEYLDELLADVAGELEQKVAVVEREFRDGTFDVATLRANQKLIRGFLHPVQGLHAYLGTGPDGGPVLRLATAQPLPVEVLGVRLGAGAEVIDWVTPAEPLRLPARDYATPLRFVDWPVFSDPSLASASDLRVAYRIPGLDEVRDVPVLPWAPDWADAPDALLHRASNADAPAFAEFVHVDEGSRRILLAAGSWEIRQDLVLPSGYEVVAGPGTRIDLREGANLLSRSRLRFQGDVDLPVVLHSSDGTGGGVLVLQAEGESLLEYVVFDGLANPSGRGVNLTGAVTFYESDARFEGAAFLDARAEDALNVVRGRFAIENSRFVATASDALDADFADGSVRATLFERTGNDAIDVSGSSLQIKDVRVEQAGDKAVSAGEQSTVEARGLTIREAEIAVASKDRSDVVLWWARIERSRVGLTAYQKKPEFGPATIEAHNLRLEDVERPYLVESGTSVVVGGREIPPTMERVEEILYGVEYGKSSR